MATGERDRGSRAERERVRVYEARKSLFEAKQTRRRRDNLMAGIAGALLIVGIVGAQIAFFTVGPGSPAPSPTAVLTPTPAPTEPSPDSTPTPAPTDPSPDSTPAPESSPTP